MSDELQRLITDYDDADKRFVVALEAETHFSEDTERLFRKRSQAAVALAIYVRKHRADVRILSPGEAVYAHVDGRAAGLLGLQYVNDAAQDGDNGN